LYVSKPGASEKVERNDPERPYEERTHVPLAEKANPSGIYTP